MLLHIEPKVEGILGALTLEEDLKWSVLALAFTAAQTCARHYASVLSFMPQKRT